MTDKKNALLLTNNSFSFWGQGWVIFSQNKLALTGSFFLILLALCAIFIPIITPYDYDTTHLHLKNTSPNAQFWFGTDALGRDLFTRIWWGARISLFVGLMASFLDLIIGVLFGSFAAIAEEKTEKIMMRVADILYAIPYLLIVILLTMIIGSGLMTLVIALTFTGWVKMARIVRAQLLQVRQMDFIKASIALGANKRHLLLQHLIPNCLGQILVTVTLTIPSAIFTEAFLSFLGLGIQAPFASWGTMSYDGLSALRSYPWRLFFPAGFISLTLLCFSFVGDGLRDAFDPRNHS